jgi:hypothetical protein
VGSRVESVVHSSTYFDVLSMSNHARARVAGAVEGVSKRVIHLVNLPAGTDIRRIREQLSRMERRLVELAKEMDELRAERPAEHDADATVGRDPG